MIHALALLLATATTAAPIDTALSKLDSLVRDQEDKPANEIKALDQRIGALQKDIRAAGPAAAEPLGRLAADAGKPLKERVWAVNFLALLEDPAAYPPLSSLALDAKEPEVVRAAALSALAATGVNPASLRDAACGALAQEDLPADALREAALLASRVGCDDPAILARRAKAYGARPTGEPGSFVCAMMISALARSHPVAAAHELWTLYAFYRPGTNERGLVLAALREQLPNLKTFPTESAVKACDALPSESKRPENAVLALRLIEELNARACAPVLLRELKNADPEVLAQDAETLIALRVKEAKEPLGKIVAGAIDDPRFAPKPGRPDPTTQLDRIRQAYISLR